MTEEGERVLWSEDEDEDEEVVIETKGLKFGRIEVGVKASGVERSERRRVTEMTLRFIIGESMAVIRLGVWKSRL